MAAPVVGNVYGVVVAYMPDVSVLRDLLATLCPQVAGVIVVDNTKDNDNRVEVVCEDKAFARVKLVRLGSNQGIARALNVGISLAIECGATHVLLSDQDSLPAKDMVSSLTRSMRELRARGKRVAAVGPTYTDRHTGITFPFQTKIQGKFFYGHERADEAHPVVEALTLITSGTLIPVTVIREIGAMKEEFFIDQVDIEWCHRARASGFSLYGIGTATMYHAMGDNVLKVWYFGWRRESAYSPVRAYYRIRNFVALCRVPTISYRWKLRSAWYCLGFTYSQVIFGQQRLQCARMCARGLLDGWRGRLGPFER